MNPDIVKVVAHRGLSGHFPENSATAFREAVALGVEMIEFDVCLTKDRVPVIIHDATVDRTSDGSGAVDSLSWKTMKALDAGSWMGPKFACERFMLLSETLDLIPKSVRLNIHIKASESSMDFLSSVVYGSIAEHGWLDNSFIASDEATIIRIKEIDSSYPVCNLSTTPQDSYISRSAAVGCKILQPSNKQTDKAFCTEAHRLGMEINPFYANDETEMRRLIDCGVDGILTDYADDLMALRKSLSQS